MQEQGIVIFEDGTTLPFGKYYCPDEPEYLKTPSHEKSFLNEVITSFAFKLSNHTYNKQLNLYNNAMLLSLAGLIIILNNQSSINSQTEILAYAPSIPTVEQIQSLEKNETLSNIKIQKVYEYQTMDWDDYIEYKNFEDYISSKSQIKRV